MITTLFLLASGLSMAGVLDAIVTVAGHVVATRLEDKRVARVLSEVRQDRSIFGADAARVDAWVVDALGADALDPFATVVVNGQKLLVTQRQQALLMDVLNDEDDTRLRPLLTKIVLQTQAAAAP